MEKYVGINIGYVLKVIIIAVAFVILHYIIGYMILISSKMYRTISKGYIESIGADFLLSYFITSTYLMVLLGFPEKLQKYAISGIIGVIICYVLNLRILINIMRNPQNIKFNGEIKSSFTRIMVASIVMLVMIVLNLYLGVCLIDVLDGYAFSQSLGYFDLFYYTMITFTTIGFGDIIPISILAKVSAIVISVTSVICLSIFLGSIFSYRCDRNIEKNETHKLNS